jgi:hypothetical protein
MAGIKVLRRIQLGREGTAGEAVACTATWRGVGTIEDQRETIFPEENVGYISGLDRSYTPKTGGELVMESTPACFENIMHVFEAGIKEVATGVADGSGSGKIYAYAFPTTSKNTIKTYTLKGGDDQEVEAVAYGFVTDFKLTGKGGEAVMVEATWKARQVGTSSFDTGAIPAVEEVLFSKGTLYIDAVSGTQGNTPVSSTFLGMDLSVKTGWIEVFSGDGATYFTFAKLTEPEIVLDITFEHDATSAAEKVNWRNGTARLLRLSFAGSTLGTAGSSYTTKALVIDLAGKWEKFDKIGDQDGNDIVVGTFRARYNSTAAKFATITVVNEVATVP